MYRPGPQILLAPSESKAFGRPVLCHHLATAKEPFSPASRDTISKWIVAAIHAAGPAALTPGVSPHAHDTRSISTSWALFNRFSVEEIHKAAYWHVDSFVSKCW